MTTQPQDQAPAEPTGEATTPPAAPEESPQPTPRRVSLPRFSRDNLETPPAGGDTGDAGSPASSDELPEPKSSKSGGSRGSSRASRRELRKAIAVGFAGAAELAHRFLARDEYAQAVGVLLADQDEADAIAEPAASIVGRRMRDAPVSDDLSDGVSLAIALGAYLLRQLELIRYAHQLRLEGANVAGLQTDLTHQQPADPDGAWVEPPAAPEPAAG